MKTFVCRSNFLQIEINCPIFFNRANNKFQRSFYDDSKKNELTSLKKPKKKIILKKILSPDPGKPIQVLEWKDAAEVIKKLNWENKKLFGPVQFSKNVNEKKLDESNQIIQHASQYPIVEPYVDSEFNSTNNPFYKNTVITKIQQNFELDKILNFPLLNKSYNEKNIQIKINELNVIRKYLENKSHLNIPSVSAILQKTMPTENAEALERWKQNMIKKLGEEGFQNYRNETFRKGDTLHASINSYLTATSEADIHIDESNIGHWKSLKSVFPNISSIKLLEERISHPFLCYKGVVDCFAKYRDHLVIIDWKTSTKLKLSLSSTFDNPLQIAAYVGAMNFDPKFQYLVTKGLIVVAYENGTPATAHLIDEGKMMQYWKEWLKRLKFFWEITDISKNV